MKILVTGGCGFIGTNYIRYVLDNTEHEIVNLDAITYAGNIANLREFESHPRYTFILGNITDKHLVDELMNGVDWVVHFAAESHVDRSINEPFVFAETNIIGTLTLLDAALRHDVARFHHVSTDEVFGALGTSGSFNEETSYAPRSPYAASKASSDHFVRAYHHTHGLPVTISNCSNNYGPYQHPEKFIPSTVTKLLRGEKVPVYGKGDNVRDWIHVTDHVLGIQKVLEEGVVGETYCFGGESEYTNIEIAKKIIHHMDQDESMIEFVTDRKGHDFRYAIDNTKVREELRWEPQHDLDLHLKATIDWYVNNSSWWSELVK